MPRIYRCRLFIAVRRLRGDSDGVPCALVGGFLIVSDIGTAEALNLNERRA